MTVLQGEFLKRENCEAGLFNIQEVQENGGFADRHACFFYVGGVF